MTATETRDEVALAVSQQFMVASRHLPRVLDLADNYLGLMSDMEAAYEQDPPDEDALARIAAEFEGNEALVIAKLENYIGLDQKFTMFEQAFKARASELRELAGIAERNRERLRARLLAAMKTMGRDKIVTPSGIVSIRVNPPAVQIVSEADIPREFIKTVVTTSVDKRLILASVKESGVIPEGVDVTRSERLAIS